MIPAHGLELSYVSMLHDIALMLNQTQKAEIQTQFNLATHGKAGPLDTSARVCVGVALPP